MRNTAILLFVCVLLLAGCANGPAFDTDQRESEEYFTYNQEHPFDAARLFVKMIECGECNCFYLYYRNPDGSETQIVWMGLQTGTEQQHPFYIIGERIFFMQADHLVSVDFSGENKQLLSGDTQEILFDWIDSVDDQWLYVSGTKWQEVYGNGTPLEGMYMIPVRVRVNADFSEIIVLADVPKISFDGTVLYEAILAE